MAPDDMRNLGTYAYMPVYSCQQYVGRGANAEVVGFKEEEGEAKEDIAETVAEKIEEKKKEMGVK